MKWGFLYDMKKHADASNRESPAHGLGPYYTSTDAGGP